MFYSALVAPQTVQNKRGYPKTVTKASPLPSIVTRMTQQRLMVRNPKNPKTVSPHESLKFKDLTFAKSLVPPRKRLELKDLLNTTTVFLGPVENFGSSGLLCSRSVTEIKPVLCVFACVEGIRY